MRHVYLGINSAYHESSAALVVDGHVAAAVEEERFNRVRHAKRAEVWNAADLPYRAIDACLAMAGCSVRHLAGVGYSFVPEIRYAGNVSQEGAALGMDGWGTEAGERSFRDGLLTVPGLLSARYGEDLSTKWTWLEHHLCHAAGAFYQSGFEESAVLCLDGIGEVASTTLWRARRGQIHCVEEVRYPHSLGFIWEKMSQFLGFSEYDASQTMALASYGRPERFRLAFDRLISLTEHGFMVSNDVTRFRSADMQGLAGHFGVSPRCPGDPLATDHYDLAAALQEANTRVVLHVSKRLRALTGLPRLCLAGGVGLNCQTNFALCSSGVFDEIYVQAAANDAGTALGAALQVAVSFDQHLEIDPRSAFLGTSFDDHAVLSALRETDFTFDRHDDIEVHVAVALAAGQIVGWFQGRMEFGPRALGARSLLADPRSLEVRRRLDAEIKFREPFRPYAPSVLEERAAEWFVLPPTLAPAWFMLTACPVKPGRRDQIPAVVHADGTARIQLVSPTLSGRFYRLIEHFDRLTGVPLLLNTSFNSRGPIVQSPSEALALFGRTSIDAMALGSYYVQSK